MKRLMGYVIIILSALVGLWLIGEIGIRIYLETPLTTDFYSSIQRARVEELQAEIGVKVAQGKGWAHLGWIAHPEMESYRIARLEGGLAKQIGQAHYGSYLVHESGIYQVWAVPYNGDAPRMIGEASLIVDKEAPSQYIPKIQGTWQFLFKPIESGEYINDHTVYQDATGDWRLVGITSHSDGDFNAERYFAVGRSPAFPPAEGMQEEAPIADFGDLAWAPHVIHDESGYTMFWSPHRLHQMESQDGIQWENHRITMAAPMHKFFRDPMVLQVAEDQWLLYTTARGGYFSQVDVYQSFNKIEWQYIRTALRSTWGSERNSPFASMESPFVAPYKDGYYLFLTYNNDTFFWNGILMLFKIWLDRQSYNETLVFYADNPYDFGVYRGLERTPNLVAQLTAHAPEIVHLTESEQWYITTAGWPWLSTLTQGEVAVAPLAWER